MHYLRPRGNKDYKPLPPVVQQAAVRIVYSSSPARRAPRAHNPEHYHRERITRSQPHTASLNAIQLPRAVPNPLSRHTHPVQ